MRCHPDVSLSVYVLSANGKESLKMIQDPRISGSAKQTFYTTIISERLHAENCLKFLVSGRFGNVST